MIRTIINACSIAVLLATSAVAGEAFRCRNCAPGYGGMPTPYGDTGCGPRYKREPTVCDPCDACNRWRSCNGVTQGPDVLMPWQLPPGRGFKGAEEAGYDTRLPCAACQRQSRRR